MALALPLLVLILFGIIFFAEALNYWNDETNAANVTARYAAVLGYAGGAPSCNGSVSTNVTQYAICKAGVDSAALNNACAQVQDLTTSGSFAQGDEVQITVRYHDQIPALGTLFGSVNIPITSSATMMLEAGPSTSQNASGGGTWNAKAWFTGGNSSTCT
jgi:hypothetical protein